MGMRAEDTLTSTYKMTMLRGRARLHKLLSII